MSQHSALPRRRNGKSQACEPCRKRKQACDHSLPVCLTCRRRKTTKDCVYLPAPMTQSSRPPSKAVSDFPTASSLVNHVLKEPPRCRQSFDLPRRSISKASSLFNCPAEFLGPTSFSAIFTENRSKFDPDSVPDHTASASSTPHLLSSDHRNGQESLSEEILQLGVRVLSQIPDEAICDNLFECNTTPLMWSIRPAAERISMLLFETFGKQLRKKDHDGLECLSRLICVNTASPIDNDEYDSFKWLDSLSGRNLRWESLGIMFTW